MTFTKAEIELIHTVICSEQAGVAVNLDAADVTDSDQLEYMLSMNRLREKLVAHEEANQ